MEFIKLENGNVVLSVSGAYVKSYFSKAKVKAKEDSDIIEIIQEGIVIDEIDYTAITSTQVLPNAAVPFNPATQSIEELIEILATDFFFEASAGGGGSCTCTCNVDVSEVGLPFSYLDAFARQRMSTPATRFDSKMLGDGLELVWDDQEVSGSGTTSTYNTNQASVTIGVSATTAGKRVRQTFRRFNYQPGKSQLSIFTFSDIATTSGISKRVGLFDDRNGIFTQSVGGVVSVGVRSSTSGSAVDSTVPQSSWNIDKLDGAGSSGITLDPTKTAIPFVDFEWLGVGTVAFGFFIDRQPIYVHLQHHANTTNIVYMSTPNLPVRYEIENDGTGAAATFTQICSTVISEGGQEETGLTLGLNRGASPLNTSLSSIHPLIGLRLNSNYIGSTVKPESFSIVCPTTAVYAWFLIYNPTITGTYAWTALSNSSIEYNTTNTSSVTLTGGTILKTGVARETNQGGQAVNSTLVNDFALGSDIAGNSLPLFLAVQRLSGASETFYASLNWLDQK